MFKRWMVALSVGVLLSISCASNASANHVGFTINGSPNNPPNNEIYECVAPCTVEVYDPDGGSYDWDFENDRHGGTFVVQANGNPASWTYQQAGTYSIAQSANGGATLLSGGGVKVIPANEAAPEDIELVSPASGKLPMVLEFTTSRAQTEFRCSDCEGEPLKRTGPDGSGRYHHFLRLDKAPASFELRVVAWNQTYEYNVHEIFTITTTGQNQADWKVSRKGDRCLVKFSKQFEATGAYSAKLKLAGKTFQKSGEAGSARIRGKAIVAPRSKVNAVLKLTVNGVTSTTKDTRKVKAGCK